MRLPGIRPRTLALVAALSLAACAGNTSAQGTDGTLPDPISAQRLDHYADMLGLSPQQRHALAPLHADYSAEFQELREGEIARLLAMRRPGYQPRQSVVKQRDLIQRIAAIDERLFDRMQGMFVDDQLAMLPRVRALRGRERIMQLRGLWSFLSPQPFDFSQVAMEVGLTPEEKQAIDPLRSAYEAALTRMMEEVLDEHFTYRLAVYDAWTRAGFTDERLTLDNAEALAAISQDLWRARADRHNAPLEGMLKLHRQTLAQVQPHISEDSHRALRMRFVRSCYERMSWQLPVLALNTSPYDEAKAQRAGLTEEAVAALQAAATAFHREREAILDVLLSRWDEHRLRYSAGNVDREQEFKDRTAIGRDADEAARRVYALRSKAAKHIEELIGPIARPTDITEPEAADPLTVDLGTVSFHRLLFGRPEVSIWLPPAISGRDIALYGEWLRLDELCRAQLSAVHQRYLDQFAPFQERHRETVRATNRALHAGDSIEGYTADNLRRHRAAEAAAISGQRAIEDAFCADVQETLGLEGDDAGLQRSRLARQRQWLNSGIYGSETRQPGGRCDGLLDLSLLLQRVRDVDIRRPEVDRVLAGYELALAPLLKARQDAMIAYSAVDDELRVEWQERRIETGEDFPDMSDRHTERELEKFRRAATVAAEPIAELNRATVEQLIKALPPDSAERVRSTFERLSWPWIYGDAACAAPGLAGALSLGDLTSQQRSQVEDVAAGFHAAYRDSCLRMIAAVETRDSPMRSTSSPTEQDRIAYIARRQERIRLAFERHELNLRTLHELRAILTPQQIAQLGGLADPPEFANQDYGG